MSESQLGGPGWAARGMQMLPGFSQRPQFHICSRDGGEEHVKSSHGATFVFIKDCKNTSVVVEGKVGKILVENGCNLTIQILSPVVGGTIEIVRCTDITFKLIADAEVPVLQIDNSSTVNVHIAKTSQLQSVYYIRSCGIFIYLGSTDASSNIDEQQALLFHLDDPSDDAEVQRVGHWDSSSVKASLISEKVVRDGIYPSTAQLR